MMSPVPATVGSSVIGRACIVFLSVLGTVARGAGEDAGPAVGAPQDILVIDEFTPDSASRWTVSGSPDFEFTPTFGLNLPAVAPSLLEVRARKIDPKHKGPSWIVISTKIRPDPAWAEADGLRVVMGLADAFKWWIQFKVVDRDGGEFAKVLESQYLPGRLVEHRLPFAGFKPEGKTKGKLNPANLEEFQIIGSVPARLYLDKVTLYRHERMEGWVHVTTSRPVNCIYERGQTVELSFTAGGRVPADARGLEYEITDDRGKVERAGWLNVPDEGDLPARATLSPGPGYYEVRGWWRGADGRRMPGGSVIRAEGSVPSGLVTFAVVPGTMEENLAGWRERGAQSFLGIHGDFHGVGDLMGLSWSNVYSRWVWDEPEKPDRSGGMAAWARDRKLLPWPGAAVRPHLLPISGNFPPPDWAKRTDGGVTPAYDWALFEAWLRDLVRVEKRLYGWMNPRIYEPAWEIDLNRPPDAFQNPPYAPADAVELHRRCRRIVQEEDPGALIIGPCPSTLNADVLDWMEKLGKAGLFETVDALSIHGYQAPPPESADLPGKIARLNKMTKRFAKRVLPVYSTEIGYPDTVGTQRDTVAQAQYLCRLAIILKGEGLRVFLPFYGIDYDAYHFGFCFNLEMDQGWGPWATNRISPKPAVPALAQVARMIEGTRPVGRVGFPSADDWGYLLERSGRPVLAVWTIGAAKPLAVRVGAVRSVEVQDMMGRSSTIPVRDGAAEVPVDASPRYVLGADPAMLAP